MKTNYMKPGIATNKWNRFYIIIVNLALMTISCISPFEPNYKGEKNLLAVDGSLIKGLETQVINISVASSITEPSYQPVSNCQVKIMDDSGNEFVFSEKSPGRYVAEINDVYLNYDTRYRLLFSTPSGETYESEYHRLLKTAPIDSIYRIKESKYIPDSSKYVTGLQFYVDLDAPDDAARYYRWQMEETWEIRASRKIFGVYDGNTIKLDIHSWPSDSLYYCWNSNLSKGIYTYSTKNLSHNILRKIPLHFKPHYSQDMSIKYCATVRQFALNEDAYYYWHQKGIELNESDQIYTTQPGQVKSNISNTNKPDEKVLGFFWVSSITVKHLFEENPFVIAPIGPKSCISYTICTDKSEQELISMLYNLIKTVRNFPKPPVYITVSINTSTGDWCASFSKDECIDCKVMGGTNHKPDFWGWHVSDLPY